MGDLTLALKEQSSMPLLSDIEDEDIWEYERMPLSFDILGQTLVEKRKTMSLSLRKSHY